MSEQFGYTTFITKYTDNLNILLSSGEYIPDVWIICWLSNFHQQVYRSSDFSYNGYIEGDMQVFSADYQQIVSSYERSYVDLFYTAAE